MLGRDETVLGEGARVIRLEKLGFAVWVMEPVRDEEWRLPILARGLDSALLAIDEATAEELTKVAEKVVDDYELDDHAVSGGVTGFAEGSTLEWCRYGSAMAFLGEWRAAAELDDPRIWLDNDAYLSASVSGDELFFRESWGDARVFVCALDAYAVMLRGIRCTVARFCETLLAVAQEGAPQKSAEITAALSSASAWLEEWDGAPKEDPARGGAAP